MNFQNFISKIRKPGVIRYTQNVSWMFFARMFTLGISFVTTLYIARTLGPTNFGELDYALSIIGLFAPLATFGIINVLQRELIKHPEQKNELNGTSLVLNFCFSVLASLAVIIFALLSPLDSVSRVLIVILSATYSLGVFQLLQQDFYARAESKIPSLITMGVWTCTSVAKIVVLTLGKGVIWLAAVSVLEQALYALALLIAYKYYTKNSILAWKFSSQLVPTILKTGGAVALVGFFGVIYARIDQVFIRHMIDAQAVGFYGAGVRLVELWNIIPALLLGGLYPALLNAKASSEDLYQSRMKRILISLIVLSIFLACAISVSAPYLIQFIFGNEFMGGVPALRVYAWSLIGTFVGQYVMNILFTEDHRRVLVVTNVLPALVNVLLNLWLIPIYGIVGAAHATVIAYSITPLVPFLFTSTRKHITDTF